MKFHLFITIILIILTQITPNNNKEDFTFTNYDPKSTDNKSLHDSIYDIIRSTNGNIFTHMRNVKQNFHTDIQHIFEKTIKDYEYRYISDKDEFVKFMYDRYQDLVYFEQNEKEEVKSKYKDMAFDFFKQIVAIYNKLNESEKKEFKKFVESQDKFTKDLIDFAIKHHLVFDDSKFKDVGSIIETLREAMFANQNLNKIKEVKGKINIKGEEIKESNKTDTNNKINYSRIKNNKKNNNNHMKNSNNTNHNNTNKTKEFLFTPPSTTLNKNFTNYINNLNNEFNLTHLHGDNHPTELKKLILNNISDKLTDHHKKTFSIFLQEYIQEAVYDNDMSLVTQFNRYNSDYTEDYDYSRFKSNESKMAEKDDTPKPSTSTMEGSGKIGAKISAIKVAKEKVKDLLLGKKSKGFGKDLSCDKPVEKEEEEIKEFIKAKSEEIKKKQLQIKLDKFEIPKNILSIGGDKNAIAGILKMIIMKFIGKMAGLIASQIPFYFFKFCLPPGPLTWGCCPEASFFPTQIYNLFTIFDKVESFKSKIRNYPSWLKSIKRSWFPEPLYYICAQGYLTMHESALFNMCNPASLLFFSTPVMLGLIPGDFPVCFITCIQVCIYLL